jgi:hypothetical protein
VEGYASLPISVCSIGPYAAECGGLWRDVRSTETDAVSVLSPPHGLERSQRELDTEPWLAGLRKATRMQSTTRIVVPSFMVASLILIGAVSSARSANE